MNVNQLIFEAQAAQLKEPTRAGVNCESAFVRQRLEREGHPEVAYLYWNWVCSVESRYDETGPHQFGPEVYEQYKALEAIDNNGYKLPKWGYSNT